jgi:putative tricarboxylic transport membrane protein
MSEFFQPLVGGISMLGDPIMWALVFAGSLVGVIVGAMPGVGTTLTYGLLLPFTFVMTPVHAVAFLLSISVGNQFGNSIPAVLMGLPGSSSAILTVIEGFTMFKRGEGGLALGVTYIASLGGQLISIPLFVILIVPLMQTVYIFAEPELCALYLLGMVAIVTLTGKNVIKGLMAAALGLGIGLVGLDPINLTRRFDFGFRIVRSGIDVVPVVIGFLAVSELFRSARQVFHYKDVAGMDTGRVHFPRWRDLKPAVPSILFGTILGTLLGAIPGVGATPSAMISYQYAQFFSKHPERFGNGAIEGIGANEAAQNASNSGELIPTLALGIPGTGSMVLLLAALTVHGFIPGPMMIRTTPQLFYAAVAGLLSSTIFLALTGWWMATVMLRLVKINRQAVTVIALVTVFMGVFSLNTRVFDVLVCLTTGLIGYFMLRYGYSTAGASLAVILGGGFERNLRIGLNFADNSWVKFLSRPITATIVAGCFALLVYGLYRTYKVRKKIEATEKSSNGG